MQRYIAFLSGLPVGYGVEGMGDLRRLFSKLGFSGVETFLTTGNVGFETAPVGVISPLEAQITRYLQKNIGDSVEVFIRTPEQLSQMLSYEAFPGEDMGEGASLFIVLLREPISAAVERRLRRSRSDVDDFRPHENSIYWLRRPGGGDPSPPPAIGEVIAMPATVRTLSTIRALAAKYGGDPAGDRRQALSDHDPATESERSRP